MSERAIREKYVSQQDWLEDVIMNAWLENDQKGNRDLAHRGLAQEAATAMSAALAAAQRVANKADVCEFNAAETAWYGWGDKTPEHEALRAAYVAGAAASSAAAETTSPFYKTLNEEAAEGNHCDQDYRPDPAQRVVGEDEGKLEHLIATELKERHCTSPDGTVVHAATKVVVHSVLAALALKVEGWREDIESAPKDGSEVLFPIEFVGRAYWCDDLKRWVLTRALHMDFIPHPTRFRLPSPPISSRAEDKP